MTLVQDSIALTQHWIVLRQKGLQEVLEDWIVLGFRMGNEIPVVDGIDMNFPLRQEEGALNATSQSH